MGKLFGTDGIRGIAYEFLTAELCEKIGAALGSILNKQSRSPRAVIGGDTRESYGMLLDALSGGLARMGVNVHIAGTVPTPAIAFFTASCDFDAGIMISASHNPYEYNGIKIFGRGGFKLSDEQEAQIEALMENDTLVSAQAKTGKIISDASLLKKYVDYLKTFAPSNKSTPRAVIDCANGSACATAKDVFQFLGKDAVFIGISPDGRNINDKCGSTNLSLLAKKVTQTGADIGIAFDGDADRFLALDERGREIDGDFVLAILADCLYEKGALLKNTVVGTVTTNYGFCEFARNHGYAFSATKVGDRYVLEEMERAGYSLGGEQSGHIIIREAATTGDGQLTALYVLSRMAQTGKALSELASVMKKYPQYTANIAATENEKSKLKNNERVASVIEDAKKLLAGSGRILVRPSGTEPVVRIMVESRDEKIAKSVCDEAAEKIKKIIES